MQWILFLMILSLNGYGGAVNFDTITVEFNTQQACESAKSTIESQFEGGTQEIYTFCLEKGEGPEAKS